MKSSCNKFYVSGAPFPRNLRKSRRNRNHKRQVGAELSQAQSQPDSQEYIVTENDIEERNPIVISTQEIYLSEGAKAL